MRYFKLNNFVILVLISLFLGINIADAASSASSLSSPSSSSSSNLTQTETQAETQTQTKTRKQIQVTVMLNNIEAKKLSKKSGDRLYINITQSSNMEPSLTKRMPEKPTLWFSKESPELKNLLLWKGNIKDNEEIKLIFSLVEQDFSAWDIDNLIGSAQLILLNKQGRLERKWEMPVFEENTIMTSKGKVVEYRMKGENSDYQVSFSLQEKVQSQ